MDNAGDVAEYTNNSMIQADISSFQHELIWKRKGGMVVGGIWPTNILHFIFQEKLSLISK